MKTIKITCLIWVVFSTVMACAAADKTAESQVVEGNSKFALELYGKLKDKEGNLFVSPYSISTALAMTYTGAKGETEKQMADALCFPPIKGEQFNKAFGKIIKRLNVSGQKGGYELVVANALWGQKNFKFLPEYISLVKTSYGGNLEQVDFKTQTEEARKAINTWVENKTKDKIKELIKQGVLDSDTRLVLTNAIYFKGKWASQFKPDQTHQAPFTLSDGKKNDVPMMGQEADFGYADINDIQLLEMPYVNKDLSMVVLLPKKADRIKNLEQQLTCDALAGWLAKMHKQEVRVFIPRFKMTSEFELAKVLGAMGMQDAFSDKADFSGMTGNKDLLISAVVHKAYVEVNEEGTEAAAATGVRMAPTSAAPSPSPLVFRADHPFIFLIRDNHTGSILFIGRVANPQS